jgi:hypothetical protein
MEVHMSKAVIWFLIGFGFFLFIVGGIFGKQLIWFIGFLMIAGGFYQGLRPGGILRKDQVLDTWATLIEKGQTRAEEIFKDTEGFIRESKAPSLKMERQSIAPGIMRGLMGTKRDFLVVTDQESFRLKPYQIFINARDYGDNLDVSWFLTYRPTIWQAILSLFPYVNVIPRTLSDLDLFDQQDLRSYTTNAHHCLLKAVEKLMADLHQDASKIDRKSRGFLGIS